jgi:hypothetical protein
MLESWASLRERREATVRLSRIQVPIFGPALQLFTSSSQNSESTRGPKSIGVINHEEFSLAKLLFWEQANLAAKYALQHHACPGICLQGSAIK